MKHESDDSDVIVYEIRDDYSVGASTKSEKKTDTTEKKGTSTPDPDQKEVDAESMAQLGGFSGRVYDKLTHRTIEGALVNIAKDLSIKTDEKGMFSVVGIKPGKYQITAFEDGYVVHSCKSSAVAGETTKLESFHLIPDCLAAQYPESTDYEEDETEEEEVVEFAMESSHVTPSEKLPEKNIEVSPEAVTVRDIPGETVPDLSTLKTIAEEETVEYPETVVDEKIPSIEVEPQKDVIATPEEEVAIAEQPSITIFSLSPVDIATAETVQSEGVPEKVQEVAPETAPQELTVEELPIDTPIEGKARAEHLEVVYKEQLFEPATEEFPAQTVQFQEHRGQLSETESFVETVSEIISQEKPPIEAALEEMQTPVIDPDLTEAVTSVPEEIIIDELSSTPVETTIAEAMQPEEILEKIQEENLETTPQEPLARQSRLKQLWGILRGKTPKEIDQEQPSEPSAGQAIEKALIRPENREQPLESTMEVLPRAIPHEDVIAETGLEEQPFETSLEEMRTPAIEPDSTKTVLSAPEEVIIKDGPSVEEILLSPIEITNAEATQSEEALLILSIEELSIATDMEDAALEEIKETVYQEQRLGQFAEDSIEQKVPLPEYQTIPLEPFVDIPPEIALQRELLEGIHEEEPPFETSLEEMQTPVIASDSAEIVIPIPEEIIIGESPSVEELSFISVEPTHKEQSVEPSTEVIPQTVEKGSVTPESASEDLKDYDISSLSDEERAAMSGEENMVEAAGFEGSINAQPNPAFRGLPITITYHLRNVACDDPDDFIIQIIVVNPDTGTIHETFEAPVTCPQGAFSIGGFTFSTASYEAYVYALSMQIVSKKTQSAHLLDGIPLEIKNLF